MLVPAAAVVLVIMLIGVAMRTVLMAVSVMMVPVAGTMRVIMSMSASVFGGMSMIMRVLVLVLMLMLMLVLVLVLVIMAVPVMTVAAAFALRGQNGVMELVGAGQAGLIEQGERAVDETGCPASGFDLARGDAFSDERQPFVEIGVMHAFDERVGEACRVLARMGGRLVLFCRHGGMSRCGWRATVSKCSQGEGAWQ